MITVFGYARLLSFLGLGPDDRLPDCAHIHACAPPRARPPSQGPQSRALSWLVGLVHGCKGVGDVVPASLGSELAAAADFVGLPPPGTASFGGSSWWTTLPVRAWRPARAIGGDGVEPEFAPAPAPANCVARVGLAALLDWGKHAETTDVEAGSCMCVGDAAPPVAVRVSGLAPSAERFGCDEWRVGGLVPCR